jgi:hypothetical protein
MNIKRIQPNKLRGFDFLTLYVLDLLKAFFFDVEINKVVFLHPPTLVVLYCLVGVLEFMLVLDVNRCVLEPLLLELVILVLPLAVIVLVFVVLEPFPVDLVVLLVYTII